MQLCRAGTRLDLSEGSNSFSLCISASAAVPTTFAVAYLLHADLLWVPVNSVTAVLMCMVTNLSLPLRNVMVKQQTVLRQAQLAMLGKAGPNSVRLALDTAVNLIFGGMVNPSPLCLIFMRSLEVPVADAVIALRLGMHRIVYEIASLMVLTRIDAVMHGSLDVLKRAAMTRKSMTFHGLCTSCCGLWEPSVNSAWQPPRYVFPHFTLLQ